jgi:hypothetical protein
VFLSVLSHPETMEVMLDILCIDRCLSIDEFYDFDDLKKLSIIPSSRMQVVCKTINSKKSELSLLSTRKLGNQK